jgi:superoxide dismutase, Cu-Zn family
MRLCIVTVAAMVGITTSALAQQMTVQTYDAPITGGKGEEIGRIVIRGGATATVVRIAIRAGGIQPGWHGVHFHAIGDCSDHGQFEKSKAHVNPESAKHGLLNPDGPDEGDLPNVFAHNDGSVNAEIATDVLLKGEGGLMDADGSALLIHAAEDDHTSQPIGNSGNRIACALIK